MKEVYRKDSQHCLRAGVGMREWKTFRLNGKLLAAYTLKETFPGEEAETLALLAYENNCKIEDIAVAVETGTPE